MIVVYSLRYFRKRSSLSAAHGPTTLCAIGASPCYADLRVGIKAHVHPCAVVLSGQRLPSGGVWYFSRFGTREFVIGPSVQFAARSILRTPPHCLKKNGTPACPHWPRMFTTQSRSIGLAPAPLSPPTITQWMPRKIDLPQVFQQRLDRQERHRGIGSSKVIDPRQAVTPVLDADTPPDVRQLGCEPQLGLQQIPHPLRTLGQDLISVPIGLGHDLGNEYDVLVGNAVRGNRSLIELTNTIRGLDQVMGSASFSGTRSRSNPCS